MRKDRVWMKFKKEDFNQLMGVLSKQMERYSEIEAQNLNLKADIKDEKECLLDLQNKIWRYSHFEKESELITMDMFPSEVKNLFWTFLLNSFHEHDYTNESYFDEYSKKHEKCIYKGNKLSKGAIQELYNMNRVGYDWLICNKDGRIFFADHGLYPLEKAIKFGIIMKLMDTVFQHSWKIRKSVINHLYHGKMNNHLIFMNFYLHKI